MTRALASLALGVATLCAPALARAQSIQLTWNAPIGCPDREQVLEAIRELMGGAAPSGDVSVRADVARVDSRLALKLVLNAQNGSSERSMESTNCDELARGAALVVALAAGREGASEAREAQKVAPVAATEPADAATAADPHQREVLPPSDNASSAPPARPARRTLAWSPRTLFAFDAGSLPRASVGGAVGTQVDAGWFSAGIETLLLVPQEVAITGGGGRFWSAALALRPCFRIALTRLHVLPCAVADLEMMVAEGTNVSFTQEGVVWFPRFGAGAEVGYALSRRIGLVTSAWVLAAPSRPTFVIDGTIPVHTPALITGRLTTGLSFVL
ncbi:MAG: hypothetical protein ACOY0T_34410 [Myxococcota bacterium]